MLQLLELYFNELQKQIALAEIFQIFFQKNGTAISTYFQIVLKQTAL